MSQKTYVHDGDEVVLTGREAIRQVPSPSPGGKMRELKKVEITPVEFASGGGWKKWVDKDHLYEIQTINVEKKKDYCPEKLQPGGCQLHNIHCGYPKCNEPPDK